MWFRNGIHCSLIEDYRLAYRFPTTLHGKLSFCKITVSRTGTTTLAYKCSYLLENRNLVLNFANRVQMFFRLLSKLLSFSSTVTFTCRLLIFSTRNGRTYLFVCRNVSKRISFYVSRTKRNHPVS